MVDEQEVKKEPLDIIKWKEASNTFRKIDITENADSVELSTPAKGGAIKIYGDFTKPEEFKEKILKAIEIRRWAQSQIEVI